jgi:hypothetical protein
MPFVSARSLSLKSLLLLPLPATICEKVIYEKSDINYRLSFTYRKRNNGRD